jgi:hypothetical protein
MTALHEHRITPSVDVGALHRDLATAYSVLAEVDGELVAEQEWTRRLRVLLALAPYGRRPWLAPFPPDERLDIGAGGSAP